jgi:hypothetical protein
MRVRVGPPVGILVVSLGLPLMIAGIAGFVAFRARRSVMSSSGGVSVPSVVDSGGMQWEGVHSAILTDVNGDGVPDIVGRIRYVLKGDKVTLAAFDGASGKKLWESDAIGTYSDSYQGALGLADDALVSVKANGEARAFGVRDGKKRWSTNLPEKAEGFCKGQHGGEVRVRLADKTSAYLRLSDGSTVPAPPAPPPPAPHPGRPTEKESDGCVRLPSDDAKGDASYELRRTDWSLDKVEGMNPGTVMQHPGGPKIVLGTRDKGTSVPMIAAVYPDASKNWKSDLAGSRPLETGPFAPEVGAVTSSRAFTEYAFTDIMKAHELVCFDLAGHRQWETAMPDDSPVTSVQATEQRVYVSQWSHLAVYEASSGKPLFQIGSK